MVDIGRTLFQHCAGTLGIGDTRPVTVDSFFWQASQTKLMTVVCIMQLVEKGLITLDEDITRILPEASDVKILEGFDDDGNPILKERKNPITLRFVEMCTGG